MDPNFVLQPNFSKSVVNTLSLLVISTEHFSQLLSDALVEAHRRKAYQYKLQVIRSEHVRDVVQHGNEIHVDYVLFGLDTRYRSCVDYVDSNMEIMDKCYACGRVCLINANPQIPLSEMNVPITALHVLRCKYQCPLLNGDVTDHEACSHLADRVLNLVHANLGTNLTASFLPWLLHNHC